jgi:hypothetical protein
MAFSAYYLLFPAEGCSEQQVMMSVCPVKNMQEFFVRCLIDLNCVIRERQGQLISLGR